MIAEEEIMATSKHFTIW